MILLAILASLALAGCAPRDISARDDDRQGVFYGGVQGGELSIQRPQDEPRPRGTSASGGSDRTDTDPGEYF